MARDVLFFILLHDARLLIMPLPLFSQLSLLSFILQLPLVCRQEAILHLKLQVARQPQVANLPRRLRQLQVPRPPRQLQVALLLQVAKPPPLMILTQLNLILWAVPLLKLLVLLLLIMELFLQVLAWDLSKSIMEADWGIWILSYNF